MAWRIARTTALVSTRFSHQLLEFTQNGATYSNSLGCDMQFSMILKLQRSWIFGAAILLIALSFMPSVAKAHDGHAHGSQPAASSPHNLDGGDASGQIANKSEQAEMSQAKASDNPTMPAGCNGGCCTGAACAACVAIAFVESPILSPPVSASSIVLLDARPSSSVAPDGLRKPPKFFA